MAVGKLIRKGLPFSNVVATQTATASIMPGRTLEGLIVSILGTGLGGGTPISAIGLVRIKANGKTFYEATGTQIEKIMKFQGLTLPTQSATAVWLPIIFTEIKGRDAVDEMAGAFDTSNGIVNVTVEMTLGAATTITQCQLYVIESPPQPAQIAPVMTKVLRYPYNSSSAGQISISLPFGPVNGAVIKRIHIEQTTANNVRGVTIKENGVVVHESSNDTATDPSVNNYNSLFGNAAQTGWYTIDFMIDDDLKNAMDTRSDKSLELLATLNAADSGMVLVEYLDTLGNL